MWRFITLGILAPLGIVVMADLALSGLVIGDEKDPTLVAYTGARIYTCAGPVIERGVLIVH
jgi:hypothetical protein